MNDLMMIRTLEATLGRIEDVLQIQVALLTIIKDTLCALLQYQGGSFLVDNDGNIVKPFIIGNNGDTIPMGTNGV